MVFNQARCTERCQGFRLTVGRGYPCLNSSGLYDRQRPTLVILDMNALKSWRNSISDGTPAEEANEEWKADVVEKERIIHGIYDKVFGPHSYFPVVFVENCVRGIK